MANERKRKDEFYPLLRPSFGEAIFRLRGQMSQEALADKAKISAGTLNRLEKGKGQFREDYVDNLCKAFGIEIDDLMRIAADCYEQARKKKEAASYPEMTGEELLTILRRARNARVRVEQQLFDIEVEIKRRQISKVEALDLPAK